METKNGYRYPGSCPFEDTYRDRCIFFGRETEKQALLHKVLAKQLVVVFSKSGIGKTSLINAGLNQSLREHECIPIKVRFNDDKMDPLQSLFTGIKKTVEQNNLDYEPGEENTLWQYFKTAAFWSSHDTLLTPVLILDQFEEFFTFHSPGRRQEFISQLADVVNGTVPAKLRKYLEPGKQFPYSDESPNVKILISIREDFLGQLDEFSEGIPDIFHNRFRLLSLTRAQAWEAITKPSQVKDEKISTVRFSFAQGTVETMLDFLCEQKERGGIFKRNEVESHQLQLLCQHIENRVRKALSKEGNEIVIQKEDLGGEKGMLKVLQNFYDNCIKQLDKRKIRKKVRQLCENGLISVTERRLSLEEEEIVRIFMVPPDILLELVNTRLLRSEKRVGSVYYELSHDTLITPIMKSQRRRKFSIAKYTTITIISILIISVIFFPTALKKTELSNFFKDSALKQVIVLYETVSNIGKEDPETYLKLGKLYYLLGLYYDSERNYKKAINNGLEDANVYNELGNVLLAQKKYDEAIENYKKAIEITPEYSEVYNNIGVAYFRKKVYYKAIEYFNKTLEIDPKYILAKSNLAQAYLVVEQVDKAFGLAKEILRQKDVSISRDVTLAMQFLTITSLFLQNKETRAKDKLQEFIDNYRSFAGSYRKGWDYNDVKNSIRNNNTLTEYNRTLLLKLIDILESPKAEGDKKLTELETMLPKKER